MTIDFICGVLAELFNSPCNFSPMDEYMLRDEYCEHHCGKVTDKDCWKRYFEKRWADRKTEPITQTETQSSNLTFEKRTMRDCYNCKRYEADGECVECHYEPKTDCQWK